MQMEEEVGHLFLCIPGLALRYEKKVDGIVAWNPGRFRLDFVFAVSNIVLFFDGLNNVGFCRNLDGGLYTRRCAVSLYVGFGHG